MHNSNKGAGILKDYYKILDSNFTDSERTIFRDFKHLVTDFTHKFDHRNNESFKLINEAFFILSNREYKKLYDLAHRRLFQQKIEEYPEILDIDDLNIYVNRARAKAYEVSEMPLDEYSKKFLKRPTYFGLILEFIASIGN